MDARDHRRIGQALDLFHWQEEAPGMVFWHPRGWRMVRCLEAAVRRHMERAGFGEVRSPQLLRQAVWEASGHWHAFADNMFKLEEDRAAALKPVSCPAHLMMARRMSLSYRDLPLRLGELGLVHRNERSGSLHGLFRLRQFVQDDGHILCADDAQVVSEVAAFCDSLAGFYAAFGFDDVSVAFASRPAQKIGDDALWDRAEALLAEAAERAAIAPAQHPGEGAFYGPKLEFILHDRLGRAWQCGTIQLDLVLAERFDVSFVDESGAARRPLVLHRAVLGSLERFLGIVLEHHAGGVPAWLAPEQVRVLPVGPAHEDAARDLVRRLRDDGLRADRDVRNESMSRRVLDAHQAAVPFVAVIGDREVAGGAVSLRGHAPMPRDEALALLKDRCRPPL